MDEKVNLATIAKMAKLSTAAVSNFINCAENFPLSEVKRQTIMEAMRQTNYRPSGASSLLRRNSVLPSKAVFIFGSYPSCNPCITHRNPMLCELLLLLLDKLKKQLGLAMEIRAIEDETNLFSWNETIADAEAVICYGKIDGKLLNLSIRRNIPLVVISETDAMPIAQPDTDALNQDMVYWNAGAHLKTMLEHVVKQGAKKLAFVSSCNVKANHPEYFAIEAEAKIAGFQDFIHAHPLLSGKLFSPPIGEKIIHVDYEARSTYDFMKDQDLRQFDAILAHNDAVAQGVAWALQSQNLKVGNDIMVGGEGDYLHCRYAIPRISTISYDKETMANEICQILQRKQRENRPQGERVMVSSKLIQRDSTNFQLK